jgi:membrane associated rhomboid family serine protease
MAYTSHSNPFGFMLTPVVKRLLIANGVAFLVTGLVFPGLLPYLVFIPAEVLTQPWTLVTYMFVHAGFLHVLLNMLGLFFFGPVLEERWGGREFLKFYLVSGLGGALLSLLFPNTAILGASAAVYGVMVAFAMYWPDNPIYIYGIFPIKAKWLVGGMVALSLVLSLGGGGSGGVAHLAHLGGALAAFLYLKSPFAPAAWGTVQTKPQQPKNPRALFPRREKPESAATTATPAARTRELHRSLDDVDRILDKISRGGMSSLTDEERQRLEEASRRFRSN